MQLCHTVQILLRLHLVQFWCTFIADDPVLMKSAKSACKQFAKRLSTASKKLKLGVCANQKSISAIDDEELNDIQREIEEKLRQDGVVDPKNGEKLWEQSKRCNELYFPQR